MENLYIVKNGKIVEYDGKATTGSVISEAALIEAYGRKALEEINRFGVYTIKK